MNNFTYEGFTLSDPQPTVKIHVEGVSYRHLIITVSTLKARRWLFKVAPKFGDFDCYDNATWKFYLQPLATYDANEIKEFLESYVEL